MKHWPHSPHIVHHQTLADTEHHKSAAAHRSWCPQGQADSQAQQLLSKPGLVSVPCTVTVERHRNLSLAWMFFPLLMSLRVAPEFLDCLIWNLRSAIFKQILQKTSNVEHRNLSVFCAALSFFAQVDLGLYLIDSLSFPQMRERQTAKTVLHKTKTWNSEKVFGKKRNQFHILRYHRKLCKPPEIPACMVTFSNLRHLPCGCAQGIWTTTLDEIGFLHENRSPQFQKGL